MQFHEKKFFSPKKLFFCWFSAYFFLFIKQYTKNTEYWHNILFFWKKIINDVFFNVFRSINGILNKTLFNKYNICNLNKEKILPKKELFQGFFHIFICWWKKTKKIHSLSRQYFYLLNCTNYLFLCFYAFFDNTYFFL